MPNVWQPQRLDSLAQIDPELLGSRTPLDMEFFYIDITSVAEGVLSFPETRIRFRNAPSRARKCVKLGDVLMSTVRPNLKAFVCFDRKTRDVVASTGFAVIRPKANADAHFIYHSLLSDDVTAQIRRRAVGSSYPAINTKDVAALLLNAPLKDEQTAIAGILDTVDESIRQTAAVIEKLKKIKVGLLHDLLTRGIDESGQLRDPVRHPEQFKDSPLGKVPNSWLIKPLGSLCDLLNGLAFKPTDWSTTGVPIIRIQNLNGGQDFNYYKFRVAEKYMIPAGTLLFSWSGNRGTSFGPFIWNGPTGILNQHIFRVYPAEDVRPQWFFYALDDVRQRVERAAHGAIGLVHVRRTDLVKYPVGRPEPNEQKQIEAVLLNHDDRIRAEEAALRKLTMMKQGLMQDLLQGRVRVPVDIAAAQAPETVATAKDKKTQKTNIYFKRSVLAAEIVSQMHKSPTFGHVKFMKTLYLVEQLAQVALQGHYHRAAAGPLDNHMIRSVDGQMERQKWFRKVPRNQGVAGKPAGYTYEAMEKAGGHREWFEKYWECARAKIQSVIDLLQPLDTQRCEIIATLYCAWADMLSAGRAVTDDAIITEVLTNWHESKQAIPHDRWSKALGWMREKALVPVCSE